MGSALGAIGSIAGAFGGGGGGGGGKAQMVDPAFIEAARDHSLDFLDQALRSAIPYSEYFTEKAINEQRRQFELSRSDVREYYERAQAQTAPYREAGFQALDTLQDTLGMSRLESGSSAMYHSMENQAKQDAARRQMRMAAAQTAQKMGMPADEAFKFVQTATYGGNTPGLMREIANYGDPTRRPLDSTKTTQKGLGKGKPIGGKMGMFGSITGDRADVSGLTNGWTRGNQANYQDITDNSYSGLLGATSNRFDVSPVAEFTRNAMNIMPDLQAARNNMSSRQSALARLGQTGYSHIPAVSRDVR